MMLNPFLFLHRNNQVVVDSNIISLTALPGRQPRENPAIDSLVTIDMPRAGKQQVSRMSP